MWFYMFIKDTSFLCNVYQRPPRDPRHTSPLWRDYYYYSTWVSQQLTLNDKNYLAIAAATVYVRCVHFNERFQATLISNSVN